MPKNGYIYILTNKTHSVLYTGVTSDLVRRIHQHRAGTVPGFTAKYKTSKLVYYETSESIRSAIAREKQLKAGSCRKKLDLVDTMNPDRR
jgi:putative endonuclease